MKYKYFLQKYPPNTPLVEIQKTFDILTDEGWELERVESINDYDEMNCYDVENKLFIFWMPVPDDEAASEEQTLESIKRRKSNSKVLHS